MKKIFLCLLLLALLKITGFSQSRILLKDDFKNNKNDWYQQKDSQFLVEIKNGALHLEKFEKNFTSRGCLWYKKLVSGLNTLNDFSITFFARYLSGGDIFEMIDVQWGTRIDNAQGLSNSSLYQLSFLMRGEVNLDYFNTNWTYFIRKPVKALMETNQFRPKELNKYELEQKDGFIILRINDKEYFKQLSNPISGNCIGFQQCLKSAWEIDKIIVRQLKAGADKSLVADSSYINSSLTKPLEENYSKNEKLKVYPNPFNDYLTVSIDLDKEETVLLNLVDVNGTLLQQHTKKLRQGLQKILLYADVIPGTYILRVQVGNAKELSTTLIKQ